MSANAQVEANATPDVNDALATLVQNVHIPAFFSKLAEYGIQPQNEQEAESLLNIGFKLASVEAATAPAEAPPTNQFAKVASDLDVLLGGEPAQAAQLQQAARELLAVPEIRKAAEALLAAG